MKNNETIKEHVGGDAHIAPQKVGGDAHIAPSSPDDAPHIAPPPPDGAPDIAPSSPDDAPPDDNPGSPELPRCSADNTPDPGDDATDDAPDPSDELQTKYMRLAADFQNFKRRTEEERLKIYSRAKEDFAEALLPVLDNFEHAIASSGNDAEAGNIIEGMNMILSQFTKILEENGIEEIAAEGLDVDPNLHHAVQTMEKDGVPEGQVVKVVQKGYKIGDKLIRPASVVVSK